MLQVRNRTPFACMLSVLPDVDGVETVFAIVKATFDVRRDRTVVAPEQAPVALVDEYRGEPGASSLLQAGEASLMKPATDVLLVGHAYAPKGKAREAAVSLRVGPLAKRVAVLGDRVWKKRLMGFKPSDPEPFERIPLAWEHAFGGTDPEPRDPTKVDHVAENPVGRGLVARQSRRSTEGLPLPNLEDPDRPIAGDGDRPPPACFAPVCPHWEPRRSWAGTYDEAWVRSRAPYLPTDFDPRHLQCAPPDQVTKAPLAGGEAVEIAGATRTGPLRFALPRWSLDVVFHFDGREEPQAPRLDTIVLQPDDGRLAMVWRAKQAVDKKLLRLTAVEVAATGGA